MAVPNVLANHIIGKEETIERVLSIPGVQVMVHPVKLAMHCSCSLKVLIGVFF